MVNRRLAVGHIVPRELWLWIMAHEITSVNCESWRFVLGGSREGSNGLQQSSSQGVLFPTFQQLAAGTVESFTAS